MVLLDALINLPPLGLAALALGCFILAFIALYATHSSPPRALFSRARPDLKHHKNAVPLLGDMLTLKESSGNHLESMKRMFDELGEVWHSSVYMPTVGPLSIINTINVQDVETVLRDPYTFVKGGIVSKILADFGGQGIIASDGEHWYAQRKTASQLFNVANFRDVFSGEFLDEVSMLCNHLEAAAKQNAIIDIQELFLRATMDTFGRIAIGTHFGCIDHQGTVVDGVYTLPANEVMSAFDYLGTVTGTRFKRPGWAVLEKLDGTEAKIRMAQNLVFDFADRMIAEKRERMKSEKEGDSPKTHKDLLDFFMHTTNFKGNPLSDEELHDVIMTFLIAGRDTTAQTLSWCLYLLSQNPDVEAKCRAEAQALGDDVPSYENLSRLRYLNATFNETLRLYPNVATTLLTCTQDTVLLGTGTKVYAGEVVLYPVYTMCRSHKLWGPDAGEFKPERWIDEQGRVRKESHFKWPVFKAGPRTCLGMNMATQQGITFLAQILRGFQLSIVNEDQPEKWGRYDPDPAKREGRYSDGLTLGMRHKAEFKVTIV